MSEVDLVKKYSDEIEVKYANFVPIDNETVGCDAALLRLDIPKAMLREYSRLRTKRNKYPDGAEFWKETGLTEALKSKYHDCYSFNAPLPDILDFLKGNVSVRYGKSTTGNPKRISLTIEEILLTSF